MVSSLSVAIDGQSRCVIAENCIAHEALRKSVSYFLKTGEEVLYESPSPPVQEVSVKFQFLQWKSRTQSFIVQEQYC